MWIKRYLYSSHHPWKDVLNWQLNKLGGNHTIEHSAIDVKYVKELKLMNFYENVLTTWYEAIRAEINASNVKEQ